MTNRVRELRENQEMTPEELARKAGLSIITINRIEEGASCRPGTKRRLLSGLGFQFENRAYVFPELMVNPPVSEIIV
jgi:transcriptional regulator with XRE-family HTH domain